MTQVQQTPPTGVRQRFGSVPPKFGGIGDAVSGVVGYIDGNRLVELASTDILGMCLPRTGIEASLRPSGYRTDAARETAIREFSGLVMNTVAVGGLSYFFMRLLGNHVNGYNPHGLPGRAWISADSLEAFGRLYEGILADDSVRTPLEARERFVHTILSSMTSTNKKPSLIGMLKAVEGLDEKARLAFLGPSFADNPKALDRLKTILKENPANLVQYADELDAEYSGKLSSQTLSELKQHFMRKTSQFDLEAMKQTQKKLLDDPKITKYLTEEQQKKLQALPVGERYDQLVEWLPEQAKAEAKQRFVKQRLNLSLTELRYAEGSMVGVADRAALGGGLTDTIQLLDAKLEPLVHGADGKPLMMGKGRKTTLKEVKHFLEQFVERGAHEARYAEDWKSKIHETLYGKAEQAQKSFWSKVVPSIQDGLIPAAVKSKWMFTHVPLFLTVASSVGVAFYNNWLTQKKHGGRVISPIDGSEIGAAPSVASEALPPDLSVPPQTFASNANTSQLNTSSPFSIFQNREKAGGLPA